ncbi:MAG: HEAT repeat domain-containing protein [Candidatus Thorarchaeota archaeon]|nr:HEAT repeat domain-containing protein [Candidatus Thorarchaeota archaeon]
MTANNRRPLMPSTAWNRFMETFFGDPYMMWHDGIDPTVVRALEGLEREEAERILLEAMEEGSYWAAMGLRELESRAAIPALKEQLRKGYGKMRIEAAKALCAIEDTLDYVPEIIRVLKEDPSPYSRLDAAMSLRYYPTKQVIDALFEAILDPDYLVRNHACESILHIHGMRASISEHKEIFSKIIVDMPEEGECDTAPADEAYRLASKMMRDLVGREGETSS